MLSKHMVDQFLEQINQSERLLETYHPATQLYHVEARYTLFRLRVILSSPPDVIEEQLLTFFKERWMLVVKSTNIQYLHDLGNPANIACIAIARELGRIADAPFLGMLMPTLLEVSPESYVTSSYTEELLLTDLILSDCNTRLIHIPDTLDSSQEDGLLRHNSLFDGKARLLSTNERNRLLSRDPSVQHAYDALQTRVVFKYEGQTLGAAVKRLIRGLEGGGVKQRGEELDSGAVANLAIAEFSDYLKTLHREKRGLLLAKGHLDPYRRHKNTVGMCWSRLSRPKDSKYKDTTYCVELIAKDLDRILDQNPDLFETNSYEGETAAVQVELNADIVATRAEMESALPLVQRHLCYEGTENALNEFVSMIFYQHAGGFSLSKADIVYFSKKYVELQDEHAFITHLPVLLRNLYRSNPYELSTEIMGELNPHEREVIRSFTGFDRSSLLSPNPMSWFQSNASSSRKRELEEDQSRHVIGRFTDA